MRYYGEKAERNEEYRKKCSTERIGKVVKEKQRKNDLTETKVGLNKVVESTWIMWEAGRMRKHFQSRNCWC